MRKKSTPEVRRIKITDEIRAAYEERDKRLDNDPDCPTLPPEAWEGAIIGKYYRPRKQPITVRVDADVIAWLRSKGGGHLTRINEILRRAMVQEALSKQR